MARIPARILSPTSQNESEKPPPCIATAAKERLSYPVTRVDLLLEARGKRIGVEVRATSSSEGVLELAQSFRKAGLTQAVFVFADPAVAERARTAAAGWPEELAATAAFTTAEHIGELL